MLLNPDQSLGVAGLTPGEEEAGVLDMVVSLLGSEEGLRSGLFLGSVNSQPSHRVCLKVGLAHSEGPSVRVMVRYCCRLILRQEPGFPHLMIVVVVSAARAVYRWARALCIGCSWAGTVGYCS